MLPLLPVCSTWSLLILLPSWLSLSEYLGTSFPPCLPASPHEKLASFALLVSLDIIFVYQLCKRSTSSSTSCTYRALCLMVTFIIFEQISDVLHHWCNLPCWHTAHRKCSFGKITSLLASYNGQGLRSDKLLNSSPLFRVQWIMAMAWWLTLLECYHIQLHCY